jgi:septum formation topological specificity factor MinE
LKQWDLICRMRSYLLRVLSEWWEMKSDGLRLNLKTCEKYRETQEITKNFKSVIDHRALHLALTKCVLRCYVSALKQWDLICHMRPYLLKVLSEWRDMKSDGLRLNLKTYESVAKYNKIRRL